MTNTSPWPDAQVAELCRLLGEGLTRSEIADQLDCTVSSVDGKVTKLRKANDPRLPSPARIAQGVRNRAVARATRRYMVAPSVIDASKPIAPRDPCWKCGTRQDIGCVHTAREKAA